MQFILGFDRVVYQLANGIAEKLRGLGSPSGCRAGLGILLFQYLLRACSLLYGFECIITIARPG